MGSDGGWRGSASVETESDVAKDSCASVAWGNVCDPDAARANDASGRDCVAGPWTLSETFPWRLDE